MYLIFYMAVPPWNTCLPDVFTKAKYTTITLLRKFQPVLIPYNLWDQYRLRC